MAFIDYYVVVGPGHNLAGAIPPTGIGLIESAMLAIDIGCVLLTVWAVAVKVATRADWEARDWVAVAAAAFVALYLEKALGRFDPTHVWQVFGAGLPLVLLWSWRLFAGLGRLLVAWWRERDARLIRFAQPVTAVLVPADCARLRLCRTTAGQGGRAALPHRRAPRRASTGWATRLRARSTPACCAISTRRSAPTQVTTGRCST